MVFFSRRPCAKLYLLDGLIPIEENTNTHDGHRLLNRLDIGTGSSFQILKLNEK